MAATGEAIKKITDRRYRIAYLMHGARNVGGGEYSIYFLISNLNREIFEPVVFYSYENEVIKKLRDAGVALIHIPLNEKITSVYRDEIKKNPLNLAVYVRHLINGIAEAARLFRKYEVDLIHPHDNLSKIIAGVAAKFSGKKVVAHCRDLLKESLAEKMLLWYQLLFIDRIIAVSESNRSLFRIFRKVPDKVRKIYNGIDLAGFDCIKAGSPVRDELGISRDAIVIGVIGVFDKCKGHMYLFEAVKQLVSAGMLNLSCLVAGDGRERAELEAFVSDRKLGRNIRFLGYRRDIPELLNEMDMVVMPSVQESFPRVPLEAMAMKVPVIATLVGGLPEAIDHGKTGLLVPPRDAASLYKAMKCLIENPALRKKMGEAGRKRVEEMFSLQSNIRKTEELYMELLNPG